MGRNTKKEAAKTRERILEVALLLFSKKGYARTTFVNIADQMGVSKGAVYWHFKNKPSLLAELIRQQYNRAHELIKTQVPQKETLEDIRNYFLTRVRLIEQDPLTRKFLFFIEYQMEWSPELLSNIQKQLQDIRCGALGGIKQALQTAQEKREMRADICVEDAAAAFFAFGKGLSSIALLDTVRINLYESAKIGIDLMIQGICEKKASQPSEKNKTRIK